MHLGLALVAGQRGSLGDFPSLGSYFLEWSTDLGVRFNGRTFDHMHYTQNDECTGEPSASAVGRVSFSNSTRTP